MPCNITVALCTYNRAGMLRQTLETLIALRTNEQFTYELLIVDDGSTDATPDVVAEFAERSPVTLSYVRQEGKGVAQARNRCVREARGEWIAMFDDDQLADPDWLLALFELAQEKNVRCVGGCRVLDLEPEVVASLPYTSRTVLGEMIAGDEPHLCGRKPLLASGTVLIARSVFDEIGMFDEKLLCGGSDLDLFQRMHAAGIDAWYTPHSICRHLIPPYRLDAKYLLWTSLRNGECFAHRDTRDWHRLRTCGAAMLRVGQSTVVHIPQWLMAAARGDRQEALGHRCRMWRTAGYVREAMRQVSPRWLSQEGFFSSLEFRKERTTLGAKQLVASMASEEFQPCQITVALCTYNRADMLRQTLETLVALRTNDLFEYELLIVDDGSTDSTPEVIQEFAEKSPVPVRYVRQEGQGVAHARNRCVREAHGSWIAMFDDDQLADPDWLLALFDLAKQRGVRCVGGSRLLNLDPEVIASLPFTNRAVLGEMVASDEPHRIGNKPLFAGGTVLIERSVFDEIGMFDEKLLYGGEDLDLFRRMQAAGIEAWYAPRSICRHLIPPYRLDAKYMLWSSLRTGECFGHRDAEEWGRFKTFGAAMLRLMQSTVLHVPLWLQAAARGKKQHALGYRCRVWRTAGYVREALRQISPRWLSQEGFFSSLEFRKERTTLGASELTASKTS